MKDELGERVVRLYRRLRGECPEEPSWQGRLAHGQEVLWVGPPYEEEPTIEGEFRRVEPGDIGHVVLDSWPIDFAVTFPSTGAFTCPRDHVRPLAGQPLALRE